MAKAARADAARGGEEVRLSDNMAGGDRGAGWRMERIVELKHAAVVVLGDVEVSRQVEYKASRPAQRVATRRAVPVAMLVVEAGLSDDQAGQHRAGQGRLENQHAVVVAV